MLTIQEKIEQINASPYKGLFIENGAGANPIANKIMIYPGSSKTILYCMTPYAKEEYTKLGESGLKKMRDLNSFNVKNNADLYYSEIPETIRAVSEFSVASIIYSDWAQSKIDFHRKMGESCTFIISTSWQLANDEKSISHGYIGIDITNNIGFPKYFHITLPKHMNRGEMIKYIGEIGIHLLYDILFNCITPDLSIDHIYNHKLHTDKYAMIDYLSACNYDSAMVFDRGEKMTRLADIDRRDDIDNIVLFKGSFNPIHNTHIDMVKQLPIKLIKSTYFVISVDTMDKGIISINDIIDRIDSIHKCGFNVILVRKPLFTNTLATIGQYVKKKIIFLTGVDTYLRLVSDYTMEPYSKGGPQISSIEEGKIVYGFQFKDIKFIVYHRAGYNEQLEKVNDIVNTLEIDNVQFASYTNEDEVSSTFVRETMVVLKKLKQILPKPVLDKIIERL